MKKRLIVQCPTCQKKLVYSSQNHSRPFCSERCKLIDLGEWAAEKHAISGTELLSEELLSDEALNEILSKTLH